MIDSYPSVGFGWLASDPDAPAVVEGVQFDGTLPTRREEYNFAARYARAEGGAAWDAGTGYVPGWHVLPYILASLGFVVFATDHDARHLAMPGCPGVVRIMHDLDERAPIDDVAVDLTCSISVLEHVSPETRESFAREAGRVTKSGGVLVVTADEYDPGSLAALFAEDFQVGEMHPDQGEHLQPRVAYVVGRRR